MAKSSKQAPKVASPPQSIKTAINSLEKSYGEGSVMRGRNTAIKVDAISTGIASLDVALGVCGLPRGRVIEIFGGESSGKTTSCLQFIAACQSTYYEDRGRYGECVFVDAEHALDLDWAEKIGVDTNRLYISQPNSGDEALDIVDTLVSTNAVDIIVVDSVAALVPKKELDGELSDVVIGAQASMMSKFMRRITSKLHNSGTIIIFINQIRMKIGQMFGNPEDTPGGRALKFYASIRMEIKRTGQIEVSEQKIGQQCRTRVIKNKVAPPYRMAEYNILYGNDGQQAGVDRVAILIETALALKIIKLGGSKYSFKVDDKEIFGVQGREKMVTMIRGSEELQKQLREATYAAGKVPVRAELSEIEDMSDGELLESLSEEE